MGMDEDDLKREYNEMMQGDDGVEVDEKELEQKYEDFYTRLRERIIAQLDKKKPPSKDTAYNALVNLLTLLPDLFHLGFKLFFDKSIPVENKAGLVFALAYVISPIDFVPDWIPVAGWVDDLIVIANALNKLFDTDDEATKEAIIKYWAGEEDVFEKVKHILDFAAEATKSLPKKFADFLQNLLK